jgi:hypothetical protein
MATSWSEMATSKSEMATSGSEMATSIYPLANSPLSATPHCIDPYGEKSSEMATWPTTRALHLYDGFDIEMTLIKAAGRLAEVLWLRVVSQMASQELRGG